MQPQSRAQLIFVLMQQMMASDLEVKFFEAAVFPGLLSVKYNKGRFHLPEQVERYVDEFIRDDSPFEMYLPVI